MFFALVPAVAAGRAQAPLLLSFGQPSTWSDKNADAGYGDVAAWYAEDGMDEQGHSIFHTAECSERKGDILPRCFQVSPLPAPLGMRASCRAAATVASVRPHSAPPSLSFSTPRTQTGIQALTSAAGRGLHTRSARRFATCRTCLQEVDERAIQP